MVLLYLLHCSDLYMTEACCSLPTLSSLITSAKVFTVASAEGSRGKRGNVDS